MTSNDCQKPTEFYPPGEWPRVLLQELQRGTGTRVQVRSLTQQAGDSYAKVPCESGGPPTTYKLAPITTLSWVNYQL